MKKDIKVKRANYIQKNNEINQEFYFAHPRTKFHLNMVYNSHFSGSSLWDLFSREVEMMENSWNMSMRVMYDLPLQTHRYFVEAISQKPHGKIVMIKNFLRFCELIIQSEKVALKSVFLAVRRNVQSGTGRNLRKIMNLTNKTDICELNSAEVIENLKFKSVPNDQNWRISILEELIEVRAGNAEIEGFLNEEITEILEHVCVS